MRFKDISNKKFGKLTAIKVVDKTTSNECKWFCLCECGKSSIVVGSYLRSGKQKQCKSCSMVGNKKGLKHGFSRSRSYNSWHGMFRRCYDESFKGYKYWGGRGITVCKEWQKIENFIKDMGERPEGMSLDRINNDGNYCKSNCRWATNEQQNQNRRI